MIILLTSEENKLCPVDFSLSLSLFDIPFLFKINLFECSKKKGGLITKKFEKINNDK